MQHYSGDQHPNIIDTIGKTPLVKLERLCSNTELNIYGKLEAFNPGGSIKDRTAKQLISHAINTGKLQYGDTVIESSSGNMAIGLAQACLYYGLNLIVVVDPLVNQHTVKILKAYGAKIEMVKEPAPIGGFLTARLNKVNELLDRVKNSFWPNQYSNPQNPIAHHQTMREIAESLSRNVDYLFAATSTCGTLMGCADYIEKNNLSTKIIAVDAAGSVIFGQPAGKRKIPGHGAGRPSNFLERDKISDVVHITDEECVIGCKRLLEKEAILCGGSSGAVVSALIKKLPYIPKRSTCALIFCDRGERYLDTIYNKEWVKENIELEKVLVA
ncbi:2,3-diaminopropionate biosynthesis protein SbnA [Chondrinema litorale]|uniref:2,3-diaminopropionate biosynthesis protein SbnA n=1 Tax=Chondrinema litorale TaxID=2994555 RepID=UPI002542F38C|nr:2,3-diaminopropionate biosynthesis protein SbnA [Chondrinema litorale]UZR98490.1 2,3-diaminopropionate biosynthesis protein SbnA [Chondrinema litorale]